MKMQSELFHVKRFISYRINNFFTKSFVSQPYIEDDKSLIYTVDIFKTINEKKNFFCYE
jgi:ribonucleotide reductase beta subunit family protein with ferritin-like domain